MPGESQGDADAPLAAVVPAADAEVARDSLDDEGVLDSGRALDARGDGTVAIPVTDPPTETAVLDVVRQSDPEPRLRDLADHLRARGFDDGEIEQAPSSWAVVGTVVLADFEGCPRPAEVGEALLDLHGGADTVCDRGPITGTTREPDVSVVAGEGDTETVHTEHGTRYALDLDRVMFSPGNKAERARMGAVVEPGEGVFDMFAGIGYFALPMARAGASVTAAELNPVAFQYLLENAALNDVTDRLDAYRGDCRDVAARVLDVEGGDGAGTGDGDAAGTAAGDTPDTATNGWADRVVMGHYDAYERLPTGLRAVAPGGVVHLHAATPEPELWDRPERRVRNAAQDVGRSVEIVDRRTVKTHSEGVHHVVLDLRVE